MDEVEGLVVAYFYYREKTRGSMTGLFGLECWV